MIYINSAFLFGSIFLMAFLGYVLGLLVGTLPERDEEEYQENIKEFENDENRSDN